MNSWLISSTLLTSSELHAVTWTGRHRTQINKRFVYWIIFKSDLHSLISSRNASKKKSNRKWCPCNLSVPSLMASRRPLLHVIPPLLHLISCHLCTVGYQNNAPNNNKRGEIPLKNHINHQCHAAFIHVNCFTMWISNKTLNTEFISS